MKKGSLNEKTHYKVVMGLTNIKCNTLLGINKIYIQTIGELKGRSFLIEDAIKQK